VDDAVRRIATTYEVRGMVATITSYATTGDGASSSSGSDAVNQVVFEYNDLAVLGGGLPTTPYVGYEYDESEADGRFTKGLRPTALRYPNGRLVHYTYGSAESTADAMNRIDSICDDASGSPGDTLAQYSYLGMGSIVQVDYPEPDLRYDLAHSSGNDPYDGLDRFGRVVDLVWRNYGTGEDAVRILHGYDRAGNRLWREDPVAASYGKDFDELYTYDGLYQLVTMQRGDLDFTDPDNPVIQSKNFAEDWSLDATGNWSTYKQDDDGDSTWDLDQTRTHNLANEITEIGGSSSHIAHDRCGNMTRIPKPDDWSDHFHLEYDGWNRLVRVLDADDTTKIAEYTYDPRNFRVLKKTYDSGQLDETRHFYYNTRWQCLEERVDSSTDPERQFIWGLRYIDELLLRDRDADVNGTVEERVYALQDANWNAAGIASSAGGLQERFIYSTFGTPEYLTSSFGALTESSHLWRALFAGYCYDAAVAWHHVRHRDLLSHLGTWNRRDPIEEDYLENRSHHVFHSDLESGLLGWRTSTPFARDPIDGAAVASFPSRGHLGGAETRDGNSYSYAGNNPATMVDPAGLEVIDIKPRVQGVKVGDCLTVLVIGHTHPFVKAIVKRHVNEFRKWYRDVWAKGGHGRTMGVCFHLGAIACMSGRFLRREIPDDLQIPDWPYSDHTLSKAAGFDALVQGISLAVRHARDESCYRCCCPGGIKLRIICQPEAKWFAQQYRNAPIPELNTTEDKLCGPEPIPKAPSWMQPKPWYIGNFTIECPSGINWPVASAAQRH